jgi:DNA-directed RNA polymerase subunit N
MQIPVRCPSCGKVIGQKWQEFQERTAEDEEQKQVLDDLNIEKYCCRTVFLTHVDSIDEVGRHQIA